MGPISRTVFRFYITLGLFNTSLSRLALSQIILPLVSPMAGRSIGFLCFSLLLLASGKHLNPANSSEEQFFDFLIASLNPQMFSALPSPSRTTASTQSGQDSSPARAQLLSRQQASLSTRASLAPFKRRRAGREDSGEELSAPPTPPESFPA